MEKKIVGEYNGHAYVDMGLSVMWATMNVGASSPEDCGDCFAWGETETKSRYDQDNCATWWEDIGDIGGTSLDVAHVKWGNPWRMPTLAEFEELLNTDNCIWTLTESGYIVKSKKTGNTIFLSYRDYWSSTPRKDDIRCANGVTYSFGPFIKSVRRNEGHSVRPVADPSSSSVIVHDDEQIVKTISPSQSSSVLTISGNINGHEYVDLGLSVKWATCNVGAPSPEDYGDYYAWGETEAQSRYGTYNCEAWERKMARIEGTSRDVAHVKWGSPWRMPTVHEILELLDQDNCKWVWTMHKGVSGYRVTSRKNGNSIFLPTAGYRSNESLYYAGRVDPTGFYWSSTPCPSEDYPGSDSDIQDGDAYALELSEGGDYTIWHSRFLGCSVRPVTE